MGHHFISLYVYTKISMEVPGSIPRVLFFSNSLYPDNSTSVSEEPIWDIALFSVFFLLHSLLSLQMAPFHPFLCVLAVLLDSKMSFSLAPVGTKLSALNSFSVGGHFFECRESRLVWGSGHRETSFRYTG